ncbi:hypothetical protein OBK13_10285 [Empedobacter falsenii]
MKKINIGLFGFGVVGEGIYKVLEEKPQLNAAIKKIVIKDDSKHEMHQLNYFQQMQKIF